MTKGKTTLEAEIKEGKLVITQEVYEGRRYFLGIIKEDDIRNRRNIIFLQEFLERVIDSYLDYNS